MPSPWWTEYGELGYSLRRGGLSRGDFEREDGGDGERARSSQVVLRQNIGGDSSEMSFQNGLNFI